MSYFKAKMHQIRFRLGLRHRPRWGSLQRSPDPVAAVRGPTSKGGGREGERKGRGAYVDTPVSARVGEGKHLPARSLLF